MFAVDQECRISVAVLIPDDGCRESSRADWACALRKNYMEREVRILLVDDHTLFRESLSRSLQVKPNFRVVGSCASGTEAIEVLSSKKVDILLLDYDLGETNGALFIENARRHFDGPVLVVTANMSDADTLQAFISGCSGIFLKHSPLSKLTEAIYTVLDGETWLDPSAVQPLVRGATVKSRPQPPVLNTRELVVLKAVLEGLANKEIARRLGVSENSVKWVVHQLFKKAGVRKRSQLVRIALEKRLFRPDATSNPD